MFVLRRIGKQFPLAQYPFHVLGDSPHRTVTSAQLRERNAMQSFGRPIPILPERPIPQGLDEMTFGSNHGRCDIGEYTIDLDWIALQIECFAVVED